MKTAYQIINLLLATGWAYDTDIRLAARMLSSEVNSRRVMEKLYADGMLTVRTVKRSNGKTAKAIRVSDLGRVDYLNMLNYKNADKAAYWIEHARGAEQKFRTSDNSRMNMMLRDSRIQIAMWLAGVKTYAYEGKPTLNNLMEQHEKYAEELNQGLYYTINEYRQWLNEDESNEADVTFRSRARGIFISDKTILVIYAGNPGDNKMIAIKPIGEKRLLETMQPLFNITHASRPLPRFSKYRTSEYTNEKVVEKQVYGEPYALIISDGNSLVYSTANGNPRGRIKTTDLLRVDNKRSSYADDHRGNERAGWLKGAYTEIYSHIFITPFTSAGITSLAYITSTSAEEWADESVSVLSHIESSHISEAGMFAGYVATDQANLPAIYMPVYDASTLYMIYEGHSPVAIITYPDMTDTVAHAIRGPAVYYDADTFTRIDPNTIVMYDQYGYPAGVHKIEIELRKKRKRASKKEIASLPARYHYDNSVKFFNEIAEGKIDVKSIANSIEKTEEIKEKKKKRIVKKMISMEVSYDFAEQIRKAAAFKGVSKAGYIKSLINKQVKEDAAAYDRMLKENRKSWK